MESYRGHFLIAAKGLCDPNFFRTVVLMVEHNDEGSMGVVINRPSSISVQNALSGHFNLPSNEQVVYFGGPVEPSALFIVHNREELHGGEDGVLPGVYVGNSPEVFESVVREVAKGTKGLEFRIFCGCAGWAPAQLEGEIARGDWFVHPAEPELVFSDDPYQVWEDALNQVYEAHRILPWMPKNPEWN